MKWTDLIDLVQRVIADILDGTSEDLIGVEIAKNVLLGKTLVRLGSPLYGYSYSYNEIENIVKSTIVDILGGKQ